MENFFKSVISALSFLSLLFFCFFSDSIDIDSDSPRSAVPAAAPSIETVIFEQAPAVITNIGENEHENKFNWKN